MASLTDYCGRRAKQLENILLLLIRRTDGLESQDPQLKITDVLYGDVHSFVYSIYNNLTGNRTL